MRFRALDGWRGLSAVMVAIFHLSINSNIAATSLVQNAYLFGDVFFVLSGFVIAHAFLAGPGVSQTATHFMLRRFGRLYPLHLFVLGLWVAMELVRLAAARHGAVAAAVPFTGETSVTALLSNLLLVQSLNVHATTTWNFPSWSISVEFYTYLIFIAVAFAIRRRSAATRCLAFSLLGLAGALVTIAGSRNGMEVTVDYGLFRCIYGFFLGAAAQSLAPAVIAGLGGLSRPVLTGLEVAGLAGLIAFVAVAYHDPLSFAAPVVFTIVTLVFAAEGGAISRLLSSRSFARIGEWSYSIYMIHAFVVINIVGRGVSVAERLTGRNLHSPPRTTIPGDTDLIDFGSRIAGDVLTLGYVALVILIASQTYRWIEMPARDWFNRLADRFGRAQALSAPASAAPRRASI